MAKDKLEIRGTKAMFEMGLKKDSFETTERTIRVTVNFEGVTAQSLAEVVFSGASFRVRLQTYMRARFSKTELDRLAKDGFSCTWTQVMKPAEMSAKEKILLLSREDYIKTMESLGIEQSAAEAAYDRLHPQEKNEDETEE